MTAIEKLWQSLETAEEIGRKMMNSSLAANWFDAEFSRIFGREARARNATEQRSLRDRIEALQEPSE